MVVTVTAATVNFTTMEVKLLKWRDSKCDIPEISDEQSQKYTSIVGSGLKTRGCIKSYSVKDPMRIGFDRQMPYRAKVFQENVKNACFPSKM
uniref:Uncharacterized protein n=1 Tax=Romanomermis culicivorax TaxID=13658 RepID=A0A915HDG2_ROMCU